MDTESEEVRQIRDWRKTSRHGRVHLTRGDPASSTKRAGFGEPLNTDRQLTGRTFCHYAIQSSAPLVIDDAGAHPVYRNVPTVQSLGVRAYVGVPLVMDDGQAIGSFCAIDNKARRWTPVEVECYRLAASAKREIDCDRASNRTRASLAQSR